MKSRIQPPTVDADVIVVGAGMAGLSAARAVAATGHRVLILEARGRFGGRVCSRRVPGLKTGVELGAEFIHGENELLQALLRRARVHVRAVPRSMWERDDEGLHPVGAYWQDIVRVADRIPSRTPLAVRQELRRQHLDPKLRARVRLFVEGFYAGGADELSARSVEADDAGASAPQQRPREGYDPVVRQLSAEAIKAGVLTRFRTIVRAIEWRRGTVAVRTSGRIYRARAAIVTQSLGLWRSGGIRFRPALPEKREAAARVGWGEVSRITLRFRRDWWRRAPLPRGLAKDGRAKFGFLSGQGLDFHTWWVPAPDVPLIVGWCGGPAARAMNRRPDREWRRRAIASLAELLGWPVAELSRWVVGSWHHNWARDPWVRGGYSYPRAGRDAAAQRLARAVADTVFIAGEATSEEAGTVQGALASGERAAQELAAAWRNDMPNAPKARG